MLGQVTGLCWVRRRVCVGSGDGPVLGQVTGLC